MRRLCRKATARPPGGTTRRPRRTTCRPQTTRSASCSRQQRTAFPSCRNQATIPQTLLYVSCRAQSRGRSAGAARLLTRDLAELELMAETRRPDRPLVRVHAGQVLRNSDCRAPHLLSGPPFRGQSLTLFLGPRSLDNCRRVWCPSIRGDMDWNRPVRHIRLGAAVLDPA